MSFSHSSIPPENEMEDKTWKGRLLAHQTELLIAAAVLVVLLLAFGIGLGGECLLGGASACWLAMNHRALRAPPPPPPVSIFDGESALGRAMCCAVRSATKSSSSWPMRVFNRMGLVVGCETVLVYS